MEFVFRFSQKRQDGVRDEAGLNRQMKMSLYLLGKCFCARRTGNRRNAKDVGELG